MTGMDTHTGPDNVLENRRDGIVKGLLALKLPQDFGDWGSADDPVPGLIRALILTYDSYMGGMFVLKDPALQRTTAFTLESLLSGEFLTTLTHSVTNIVLSDRVVMRFNATHKSSVYIKWVNFTGDDAVGVFRIDSGWTQQDIIDMAQLITEVGAELGFPFNMAKTLTRFRVFEYLKKLVCYGVYIPLAMRIAPIETERGGFDNSLPEKIGGQHDKLLEYALRGGDVTFTSSVMLWLMSLMLVVKFQGQKIAGSSDVVSTRKLTKGEALRDRSFFSVPFSWLMLPRAYGGPAIFFDLLAGKSDALIMRKPGPVRDRLLVVAAQMKRVTLEPGSLIDPLVVFPQFRKGVAFQSDMLNGQKIQNAIDAQKAFTKYTGVTLAPNMQYQNSPEFVVKSLLEGVLDTGDVRSMQKASVAAFFEPTVPLKFTDTKLGWLDYIDVKFGETVPEVYLPDVVTPVAGAQGLARVAFRTIGVGASQKGSRPLALITKLMVSTGMKHLTPEGVLEKIMRAKWRTDPGAVQAFLVSLGAETDMAGEVATRLATEQYNILALEDMKAWTMKDSWRSLWDVGPQTWERFVTVNYGSDLRAKYGQMEDSFLQQYGMTLAVANQLKHVTLTVTSEFTTWYRQKIVLSSDSVDFF
jgi:hypothetical protein